MLPQTRPHTVVHFEIRFEFLYRPGRAMSFPCDERGSVDLDALPRPALSNYLFARAMVGREFTVPAIISA